MILCYEDCIFSYFIKKRRKVQMAVLATHTLRLFYLAYLAYLDFLLSAGSPRRLLILGRISAEQETA